MYRSLQLSTFRKIRFDFKTNYWTIRKYFPVCVLLSYQTEFMDYLPRGEGNTKNFGGIDVTIKQIVKKADYTLTTLNIADSKVIIFW